MKLTFAIVFAKNPNRRMILSMTGYGAATAKSPNYKITVELKSLNNKYLELSLRLPRTYLQFEHKIRSMLSNSLERGKVSMFINTEVLNPGKRSLNINQVLAQSYLQELNDVRASLGIKEEVNLEYLLGLPEVIANDASEPDPEEWAMIQQATEGAIEKLKESRAAEGEALAQDLSQRIQAITTNLAEVETRAPERVSYVRERVMSSLSDLQGRVDFDQNRFEQELMYYVEKLVCRGGRIRTCGPLLPKQVR
jgi:uncharacterized protein (TIGR00255 family)